jgi:exodeoxyribonuclease VII large subunit
MAQLKNKKIYSVSQITSMVKTSLEAALPPRMTVNGEIGSFKHHRQSGHCYFTLKDEDSVLQCVMWRSNYRKVKFEPEEGMQVLASGFVDVYPPRGQYQFYAEQLQSTGTGDLQIAFEQMVKRLEKEGLFDDSRKKPLPRYPSRIGIMTSRSGAAIHDITESIHTRFPCVKLLFYPVPVQGKGADKKIAEGLKYLNKHSNELNLDMIILGRGGGSLEDLWSFNEEAVARAIYTSRIPIVSAVGHEVDTTIADLVADKRASTPTKAGVAAVPDIIDVNAQLEQLGKRLNTHIKNLLENKYRSMETVQASSVFRNPLFCLRQRTQQVDELSNKLYLETDGLINRTRKKLDGFAEQIARIEPHQLIGAQNVKLNNKINKLQTAMQNKIYNKNIQLTSQTSRLKALNPKSVLKRGYSITTDKKTGKLIKKPDDVKTGELIMTEFAGENFIESEVTKK